MTKNTIFAEYLENDSGATAIEYALLAALIAVGIIAGVTVFAMSINDLFGGVDGDLSGAFDN